MPRRVHHRSRKTIGIRVPDHKIALMFLETVGEPLLATTFIPPNDTEPYTNYEDFEAEYQHELAGIINAGNCSGVGTTVIDLTQTPAEIVRRGSGDPATIGL